MIELGRPAPALAISTALLYSLDQPRSVRPVRDDARLNPFPGLHARSARSEAVSKGNRFQAYAYEEP